MEEIDLKELFDYLKGKIIWIILAVFFAVIVGNVYTIRRGSEVTITVTPSDGLCIKDFILE